MGLMSRRPLPMIIESANIRYNQSTDYVELLHPITGEWVEWQRSGIMFTGTNIIVSTKNLNGKTVVCSIGDRTYTGVFLGGACTFTVDSPGTASISCDGYSTTVEVEEGLTVSVDLSRPFATLTLITENLNGSYIQVKIDGVNYTATFVNKKAVLTIYEVGTATISCSTVTVTQEIEAGGSYTVNVTRPFASLDFETSDLNGKTVVVKVDGQTYTGTFSNNSCRITVYHFGTAIITCDYATTSVEIAQDDSLFIELNRPYCQLTLNTTTLEGQSVIVSVGGKNYTGKFVNKTCTIKIYDVFGVATITSTNASKEFTVESGKTHFVTLDRPYSNIHLSTENLHNQTITFTVNGVSNQVAFGGDGTLDLTVYEFGLYTFTCSETTVEQLVEPGKLYEVDITEIVRFYLLENGQLVNGTEFVSTQYKGEYKSEYEALFISMNGNDETDYGDLFKMPKNDKFVGKTITVEFYVGENSSLYPSGFSISKYLRYRYGLTSSGYYADALVNETVIEGCKYWSLDLEENMFTRGFTESHYLALQNLPQYGQSKLGVYIRNIYVE